MGFANIFSAISEGHKISKESHKLTITALALNHNSKSNVKKTHADKEALEFQEDAKYEVKQIGLEGEIRSLSKIRRIKVTGKAQMDSDLSIIQIKIHQYRRNQFGISVSSP